VPKWLSPEAKAEWRRVMPILVERRILTTTDLGSLENYCISSGRVRAVEAEMQAATDPEMRVKLFRVQDKAMASARLLAAELGLTPVSRSRPAIREDDDADSLLD
jgi:P27 family predicted phage terminase small subunit